MELLLGPWMAPESIFSLVVTVGIALSMVGVGWLSRRFEPRSEMEQTLGIVWLLLSLALLGSLVMLMHVVVVDNGPLTLGVQIGSGSGKTP